ncbi:hypothetical protein [Methanothrix sp.]|uniref:hypothetical protein n=1 Tax=Methanothrix sp. TaxID=90426 RepID=UPI001BD43E73
MPALRDATRRADMLWGVRITYPAAAPAGTIPCCTDVASALLYGRISLGISPL